MTRTLHLPTETSPHGLGRAVLGGAGAGVVASMVMAVYAMAASWEKGTGLFTPLHHIASLWVSPESMMVSMQAAMAGDAFDLAAGAAVVGVLIHLSTGALYGAVFGLAVVRLHLALAARVALGVGYGLAVFAVSAFVGLPLAAALFDSGDAIANMAEMAGWWTFALEHLLFGATVGLLTHGARRAPSRS